jgi:VIT1/CCC1 family predicted Fe2+/Mn2+ transporter
MSQPFRQTNPKMAGTRVEPTFANDAQGESLASKLNWLRAGVMGANDGIVSTAGVLLGVAGAAVSNHALLVSGVAAVVAGAISMAVGEYVSVSTQRDSERAEIEHERRELTANPQQGLDQLADLIQAQGIDPKLACQVAIQLTRKDSLSAHARLELGIDPTERVNPWTAAFASMLSFVTGGAIPFAAIVLSPREVAVMVTAVAVVIALAITGSLSAHLGHAPKLRAALRTVSGGIIAMAITYGVGTLVGGDGL